VALLPQALAHADIAHARIEFEGFEHASPNFQEGLWRLSAPLVASHKHYGVVEVFYAERRPAAAGEGSRGPFTAAERVLLDRVAKMLGQAIEARLSELARRRALHDMGERLK